MGLSGICPARTGPDKRKINRKPAFIASAGLLEIFISNPVWFD
jgi:hypothetical protein